MHPRSHAGWTKIAKEKRDATNSVSLPTKSVEEHDLHSTIEEIERDTYVQCLFAGAVCFGFHNGSALIVHWWASTAVALAGYRLHRHRHKELQ